MVHYKVSMSTKTTHKQMNKQKSDEKKSARQNETKHYNLIK
jgi:hypothetical protein